LVLWSKYLLSPVYLDMADFGQWVLGNGIEMAT
jgi:hypothetical protein